MYCSRSKTLQQKVLHMFTVVFSNVENNISKVANVGTWHSLKNGMKARWPSAIKLKETFIR